MATGIVETSGSQQSQPGEKQSRSPKMVQRLLMASSLPQFLNDLLGTMAVVVAGTEAAGFALERDAENPERAGLRPIAHIRPDESDADTRAAAIKAFQELLVPCVQQDKDGAIEVGSPDGGEPQFCLVCLLRTEGNVVAVAAVITRCRDQERARQRLMSMQLVAGYFELYTMRHAAEQTKIVARNQQDVLQLASAFGTAEGFESGAMNLCNELANRTGATRVSLGWLKGRNIKVKALSHTEKFDKKQELIVQIEKAMEECADQEEPVRYDCDGQRSNNVTRCAEALSRQQGGNSVLSLPLRGKEDVWGVLTLEWNPPQKPDDRTFDSLVIASGVMAPQIHDRFQNDRWLAMKVAHSIQENAKMVMGPKHMIVKLVVLLVLGLGVFINVCKPMYHVSAPFTLEAVGRQTVSAPYEGQIVEVDVKLGQRVKAGDRLLAFDTTELQLKKNQAERERDSHMGDYRKYLADPQKRAEAMVSLQRAHESQAEADLYQYEIAKGTLVAPFDGVIIKGELDDMVRKAVKEGDPLMELAPEPAPTALAAPCAARVVEMKVKLGQHVRAGQQLAILRSGMPGPATQPLAEPAAGPLPVESATQPVAAEPAAPPALAASSTQPADASAPPASAEPSAPPATQSALAGASTPPATQGALAGASTPPATQPGDVVLVAPCDGTVVKAALFDDAAVKQGDVLLEIAPDVLRVVLAVSERDIQELKDPAKVGADHAQHGKLATTSFPNQKVAFQIDRIVQQSDPNAKESENVFKVYARLEETAPGMLPGMAGEAKVDIQHKSIAWMWTHRLVEYLQLKIWQYL